MEVIIIFLLILLNGMFAMAEIAIISSRKSRLRALANKGDEPAKKALELAESPNRFLSTTQIGITLVGIFAGAFGGATIAANIENSLNTTPLAPYAEAFSIAIVVLAITYLSLIFGELVPKRIALSSPEKIASFLAGPMTIIAKVTSPVIHILSSSTNIVLGILHITDKETKVSQDEVKMLVREGARTGVFEHVEKDIIVGALTFADKKAKELMTPRKEVISIKTVTSSQELRKLIAKRPRSYYPVIKDTLDSTIGVLRTEDILPLLFSGKNFEWKNFLHKPLFVPEASDSLKILEMYKKSGIHQALVIDEYGHVKGLLTLGDVLESIVGDIPEVNEAGDEEIQKRDDGSYLLDGLLPIEKFKTYFKLKKLLGEKSGAYTTVGGYVMHKIGKIPKSGDKISLKDYTLEVVDMDGNRVDKILLESKLEKGHIV